MFEISIDSIEEYKSKSLLTPDCGAVVTFEGRVRNHNEGQCVDSLEYEVYKTLAEKEGEKILQNAKVKFHIINAFCIHRIGHLQIGDLAVWIGVTSKHRREAFKACEFIINSVKEAVPIWKKENYCDKSIESKWVYCQEDYH
ncbi:MAG: molybdopterin-converting factor chain 2 [Ignavibacteriales bacterium CG_4_9_14_3_um_filter_30_11]|nr:MAG: molybdopterin-converting factor chain 2 [Ignavibacteriales bacterium CG_4_9_14_3_um_filter_30_11]